MASVKMSLICQASAKPQAVTTFIASILLVLCLETGRATPSIHGGSGININGGGGGAGAIAIITTADNNEQMHALHVDKSRPQEDESFLFNEIDDDVNCKCEFLPINTLPILK
jgi:hypothetical protein